ncbi:MAG: hypothetical protein Q8K82_19455 [Gemmatimonadaceae bacterium]|nr:hypothetical protein [Gemmatimonadaceae bacterium]
MRRAIAAPITALIVTVTACATVAPSVSPTAGVSAPTAVESGQLAQIYYWKAKPGKFDEYSRYIREVAEPIDMEAHRRGAFLSVTTYAVRDTANAWTHMRAFVLRDSAQLGALGGALESAGIRLEPDSAKRRVRGEYSATLRERIGATVGVVLR